MSPNYSLNEIVAQKGTSLPNLSLAWLLVQNGVDVVIPGGKRKEHIIGNIAASDIVLSEDELRSIVDVL